MEEVLKTYFRTGKHPEIRAINTQGGALLPLSMAEKIHERASILYPLTKLSPTNFVNSNKVKVPYQKSGITLSWLEEGESIPSTSMEMGGLIFRLNKTAASFKVSEETFADSAFDIESLLVETFANDLGKALEDVYINGDGIGKPQGFLNSCTKISAAGSTVAYTDIKRLFDSLALEYASNSAWILNKNLFTTLAADDSIIELNDSPEPGSPCGYILSRPCYISFMPEDHPIAIGDFSNYQVLQTVPIVQRLYEKYSNTGYAGFLLKAFIDGRLLKQDSVIVLEV